MMFELAATNLLAPPALFFALGLFAAWVRSDLSMPEAAAKLLSLYLLLSIGFKGGVAAHSAGLSLEIIGALAVGFAMSALMPVLIFPIFKKLAGLDGVTAAATAAHYGSISIVTFVAASDFAQRAEIAVSGHMIAVAVVMESPAILTGLVLASLSVVKSPSLSSAQASAQAHADGTATAPPKSHGSKTDLMREVFFNGSVVLLVGAFAIGLITGGDGMDRLKPFVTEMFQGALCLFLLEMGLVAGRRLFHGGGISFGLVFAALVSTWLGAAIGFLGARLIGASHGDTAILMTLGASASYIAVPAAMRVALPDANPGAYLTASLGVTFPFNLIIGLPAYFWVANLIQK
jgi:uncharacterized protein